MKCMKCNSKVKESFDFCPYCGIDLQNPEEDMKNFGVIGKNEFSSGVPLAGGLGGLGISDKLINTLFNSIMKNLEKQMKNSGDSEVQSFPNGIKIRFEVPKNKSVSNKPIKKGITQEQLKRMSGLPRVEAKTNVRRFSDRVVYELNAPGVESPEDIFVSKLESGYEVKAIGKKKVYVNSLPVDLPLKGLRVTLEGLSVEFGLEN